MEVTDCAILLWLSITTLIIVPKIEAANINSRELNNNEKHLVNVTRNHEGDIIFFKGNAIENNYLRTLECKNIFFEDELDILAQLNIMHEIHFKFF